LLYTFGRALAYVVLGVAIMAGLMASGETLFGDGICARIKEELLTNFNLHTVVRLPQGVFEPYTPIQTNLLFFDRAHPTDVIWYYEHPLPEGRKKYTKTSPLESEELVDLLKWFNARSRQESAHAWRVEARDVLANGCNLDIKNPRGAEALEHIPPKQLAASIADKNRLVGEILEEIRSVLDEPVAPAGGSDDGE